MNRLGLTSADGAAVGGSSGDGDVASWSRNWHETVILSGIELQRQKVGESSKSTPSGYPGTAVEMLVVQMVAQADYRPSKLSISNSSNVSSRIGNLRKLGYCRRN
jgi:hypothetical protein